MKEDKNKFRKKLEAIKRRKIKGIKIKNDKKMAKKELQNASNIYHTNYTCISDFTRK